MRDISTFHFPLPTPKLVLQIEFIDPTLTIASIFIHIFVTRNGNGSSVSNSLMVADKRLFGGSSSEWMLMIHA